MLYAFAGTKVLPKDFMAGLDACLKNGADIIVNTDADNQYCGADIETLVRPILEQKAHIVIGERPIDDTELFTPLKKKLQLFWQRGLCARQVRRRFRMRQADSVRIPEEAAMRINVINDYTYTLETIVQSGRRKNGGDVSANPDPTPNCVNSRLVSQHGGIY